MDISKALGRRIPFASLLGIELLERGEGRAVLRLALREELMNSFGAAHGGVVMTLLDIAMATAARSLDPKAVGAITVEMKTSFLGAGKGVLIATGECLHLGRSVAFCEGKVHGADGKLAASASGTFMLRHAK
ncbi:MAG TPA: PaaI family thioesterase [Usitatibacter sp.]|nr:PaaI family thioesterase [Usitatibacter sp.]